MSNAVRTESRGWDKAQTVLLFFGVVLVFVLFGPILKSLVQQWWDDPNYRHGLLVPIISGVVLFQRRDALRNVPNRHGAVIGSLLILLAAGLLVVGTAASELMTMRLSFPTFLIGCVVFLRGAEFAKRALFPLLFLYMMVPLPYLIYYKIAFPLQLLGAKISANALDGLGVHVIRNGNILHLPNYSLEVVAACSGLRSLMTMVTLSLVIGAFSGLAAWKRLILVLFAVPAALAANMLRLIVTGLGAYMVSPKFADGFLHTFSGIVVFATGMVVLLSAYFLLRRLP